MKLSKAQQEVVDKMQEGWELAISEGFYATSWIQKNGIGKGCESQDVRLSTAKCLANKCVVEVSGQRYPFTYYRLTEQYKNKPK